MRLSNRTVMMALLFVILGTTATYAQKNAITAATAPLPLALPGYGPLQLKSCFVV